MSKLISKSLIRVLAKNRILLHFIVKKEKGELYSQTIREYFASRYKVIVDKYTYGGCFKRDFNVGGEVIIGRYTSIAQGVHYYGANHPTNWFSTSAIFYNQLCGFQVQDVERHKLIIGNDVWIGANSQIMCSCEHIGNGAVVAAGSVVTKDIPPYAVVAGVPAKIIKYRFDDITIEALTSSKWWEMEPESLMQFYNYKDKPLQFAKELLSKI